MRSLVVQLTVLLPALAALGGLLLRRSQPVSGLVAVGSAARAMARACSATSRASAYRPK